VKFNAGCGKWLERCWSISKQVEMFVNWKWCKIAIQLTTELKLNDVNSSQSDLLVAISRLHNWSCVWQLQTAIERWFICNASNTRHNDGCTGSSYGISNHTFASVDSVHDLCVTIDCQLKLDKHIAGIVHKAMNRANRILKSFHSRDRTLLTNAFCTYARPLLEYCSPSGLHILIVC